MIKLLARLVGFVVVICAILLPPLLLIDYKDSMTERLLVQVFLPMTIISIVLFGFMD